jgi:hypothetical protein
MNLEPLHPIQIERFRAMTPTEKFAVARGLLATARKVRREGIRRVHPDWDADAVERELARETACART